MSYKLDCEKEEKAYRRGIKGGLETALLFLQRKTREETLTILGSMLRTFDAPAAPAVVWTPMLQSPPLVEKSYLIRAHHRTTGAATERCVEWRLGEYGWSWIKLGRELVPTGWREYPPSTENCPETATFGQCYPVAAPKEFRELIDLPRSKGWYVLALRSLMTGQDRTCAGFWNGRMWSGWQAGPERDDWFPVGWR